MLAATAYPSVFTVTSNANAGNGSLREALTLASTNGTTDQDFIHFNLPNLSEAGRTITLLSRLPPVSSNLTIDASTQPGPVFGVSTARVQLITAFSFPTFPDFENIHSGLELWNVQDVEVLSLYIRNLLPLPESVESGYSPYSQGISIRYCKNIRIGAAGKGNVICGFSLDIATNVWIENRPKSDSENISLKGTFISLEADGSTLSPFVSTVVTFFEVYGQLDIGGTPAEGNVLPRGLLIVTKKFTPANPGDIDLRPSPTTVIRNNKIGLDYGGIQNKAELWGLRISLEESDEKNTITIEDNVISATSVKGVQVSGIHISNNIGLVTIRRNFIGIDKTRTKKIPVGDVGIIVNNCDRVVIGGSDVKDANYIAYCKPILIRLASSVAVNKNSFFCSTDLYPMIIISPVTKTFPVIQITSITASSVSGTATPNSSIELFYNDRCGTCSPETYFASAMADAAGNWKYQGAINGSVIASATYDDVTSEFTRVQLDVRTVTIVHACSNTGSITGIVPMNATDIKWLDASDNVVGTDPDLLNVPVGKYKLQIGNGECIDETGYYEVQRALDLNTANVNNSSPSCEANGYIKGIKAINYTASETIYSWRNAGGIEIGSTADLNDIKAGVYTLNVSTADNSCSKTYGPVNLPNSNEIMSSPDVSDLQICNYGAASLLVNKTSDEYGYRLYDKIDSPVPADQQVSGKFNIQVKAERSFYVSQYIGDCESRRKEVKVRVSFASINIPDAITPNADGYNDTWLIKGLEKFPRVGVKLFNRFGTKVFETPNYHMAFDGTRNGNPLPVGTYYYFVNLGEGCNPISGSLTILR